MARTYNFGVYHWRRRFRRIAAALALAAVSLLLWRWDRSGRPNRPRRLAAALLGLAAAKRGAGPIRRLLSPPPWALEREKYDALGRALDVADADRVLDVGCGTGRSLVGLAPWLSGDATVVGLDVFDSRVILGNGPALARRNAARAGLDVETVAGDAAGLPVGDDTVDAVTACRVLHDLPRADAESALAEARRVCRPGGTLGVLELPLTHGTDADPLDYWRQKVADAGFDVRRAERVTRDGETAYVAVVATPAGE